MAGLKPWKPESERKEMRLMSMSVARRSAPGKSSVMPNTRTLMWSVFTDDNRTLGYSQQAGKAFWLTRSNCGRTKATITRMIS